MEIFTYDVYYVHIYVCDLIGMRTRDLSKFRFSNVASVINANYISTVHEIALINIEYKQILDLMPEYSNID